MPELINKLKKFMFVFLVTFSTCILLGYLIDVIFGVKVYQSLFMGAAIAGSMGNVSRNKTVKKQ